MTQNALFELSPDLIDKLHECPMYVFDGHCVPRATTILSNTLPNESIVFWANSLGFKGIGYRKELNRLAAIGTLSHNQIETYLGKGIYPEEPTPSFESFLQWWEKVNGLGSPNGILVLQLPRDGNGYKEYSYSYSIPEHAEFLNHAEENFFQLVKSYWYTKIGEDMFKRCS